MGRQTIYNDLQVVPYSGPQRTYLHTVLVTDIVLRVNVPRGPGISIIKRSGWRRHRRNCNDGRRKIRRFLVFWVVWLGALATRLRFRPEIKVQSCCPGYGVRYETKQNPRHAASLLLRITSAFDSIDSHREPTNIKARGTLLGVAQWPRLGGDPRHLRFQLSYGN